MGGAMLSRKFLWGAKLSRKFSWRGPSLPSGIFLPSLQYFTSYLAHFEMKFAKFQLFHTNFMISDVKLTQIQGVAKKNRTHFKLYSELPGSGPVQGRHCCSGSAYKTPDFKESIETKFVKIASIGAKLLTFVIRSNKKKTPCTVYFKNYLCMCMFHI